MRIFKITALLFIFAITSCVSVQVKDNTLANTAETSKTPKNIILLIGDGMGLSQVSASFYYNEVTSNFWRFPVVGLIRTTSSSHLITDSAAGATAFSAGVKTYNGAIGVDKDTLAAKTIVEWISEERNMATGIISTSSVVHATPASFYAHVDQRRKYEEIADWLPKSDLDFVAGGGQVFFHGRKDEKDLYEDLKNEGFDLSTDALPSKISENKMAILLAEDGMPKMLEGRGDFLPDATQLALSKLTKDENGFFLMVEGSQIDWGGHANDADYLISEQLDFDKTIGVALDFAKLNKETLVIVTADHETGGFTLASKDGNYNEIAPTFSTGGHSTTLVPVFAFGPGSEKFNGVYENTEIYQKMMSFFE
jgi:alkaline phosphatase